MTTRGWSVSSLAVLAAAAALSVLGTVSCARSPTPAAPTAAAAKAFLDTVNQTMLKLGVAQNQAGWVQQNFITDDTEALASRISTTTTPSAASQKNPRGSMRWTCRPTSGARSTS